MADKADKGYYPERGEYAEPYEYDASMLGSAMQEQGRRRSARETKDPELRKYYERRATQAHEGMQEEARLGLESRRSKAAARKRAANKRK
jgi:hypothetical protein